MVIPNGMFSINFNQQNGNYNKEFKVQVQFRSKYRLKIRI